LLDYIFSLEFNFFQILLQFSVDSHPPGSPGLRFAACYLRSVLHFIYIFHVNGGKPPVYIDDDGNGYGRFGRGNGDHEYAEKVTLELTRVKVFVERDKVDIHRIQDELDRHQDGDEVAPGDEAVNADKKHRRADHQEMT
jgi:hypothetical protein